MTRKSDLEQFCYNDVDTYVAILISTSIITMMNSSMDSDITLVQSKPHVLIDSQPIGTRQKDKKRTESIHA